MKIRALVMILVGLITVDAVAGEIMIVGAPPKMVRSGNRTYYVPGADTTSDYGLGISGQIQKANGLWVTEVEKGTDAAKMGLEVSDWIVAINDRPVTLENWEAAFTKGGRIQFTIKDHKTEKTAKREITLPQKGPPVMHGSASRGRK